MAAIKIRINELARELGVDGSRSQRPCSPQFDTIVKSHSSTIEQDLADKVRGGINRGRVNRLRPAKKETIDVPPAKPTPAKKEEPKPAPKPATLVASKQQPKPPVVEKPAPPDRQRKKSRWKKSLSR